MKRIVVTGVGMVTPLANGARATWQRLIASESGIHGMETFDVSDIACRIAGQIPRGDAPHAFRPDEVMTPKDQRKVDEFILFAVAAAVEIAERKGMAGKRIVVILPSFAERYLSTALFDGV